MTKPACADCGKKRKRGMTFDWLSKQWFCARCFKTLLKDYRSASSDGAPKNAGAINFGRWFKRHRGKKCRRSVK